MRITNYVIITFIVILSLITVTDSRQQKLDKIVNSQVEYNQRVDTALDDALDSVVEVADGLDTDINYEEVIDRFFKSLYASFGVSTSESGQKLLQLYIPVIALVTNDGVRFYYNDVESEELVHRWSPKMPFCYKASNGGEDYYVNFRQDDTLSVNVPVYENGLFKEYLTFEGTPESIRYYAENDEEYRDKLYYLFNSDYNQSPGDNANDRLLFAEGYEGYYQSVKNETIAKAVAQGFSVYLRKYNSVANSLGVDYHFSLPVTSSDSLARSINGVTFMAIFQGYPYGAGTDDVYSNFAVSGTRVTKKHYYFVCKDNDSGISYYHKEWCNRVKYRSNRFESKEEAARSGAFPCDACMQ